MVIYIEDFTQPFSRDKLTCAGMTINRYGYEYVRLRQYVCPPVSINKSPNVLPENVLLV